MEILFLGGGIIIAISCALMGFRQGGGARTTFGIIAFIALIAQGGCWLVAVGIGNATSGGQGGNGSVVIIIGVIGALCAFLLLKPSKNENISEPTDNRNISEAQNNEQKVRGHCLACGETFETFRNFCPKCSSGDVKRIKIKNEST